MRLDQSILSNSLQVAAVPSTYYGDSTGRKQNGRRRDGI